MTLCRCHNFHQRKVCFASRRPSCGVADRDSTRYWRRSSRREVFLVVMFGEVAVLFMGVIFPHVDAAIPLMPPHVWSSVSERRLAHMFAAGFVWTAKSRRRWRSVRTTRTIRVLPSSWSRVCEFPLMALLRARPECKYSFRERSCPNSWRRWQGPFFLVAEGAGSVIDQIVLLGMKFSTFLIIFDVYTWKWMKGQSHRDAMESWLMVNDEKYLIFLKSNTVACIWYEIYNFSKSRTTSLLKKVFSIVTWQCPYRPIDDQSSSSRKWLIRCCDTVYAYTKYWWWRKYGDSHESDPEKVEQWLIFTSCVWHHDENKEDCIQYSEHAYLKLIMDQNHDTGDNGKT